MEYSRELKSACEYGRNGMTEQWVHEYLMTDGHNVPFADGLKLAKRNYYPPREFDISLFHRICGPEPGMKYQTDRPGFEMRVAWLTEAIRAGADLPPLIVSYHRGEGFELNDGNHRLEAYSRLGYDTVWAIVWITEEEDKAEFDSIYGGCDA